MTTLNINKHNFREMRRVFHSRISQFLPVIQYDTSHISEVELLEASDQEQLELFQNIEFDAGNSFEKVKVAFEAAVEETSLKPVDTSPTDQTQRHYPLPTPPNTFEALLSMGWLIESGGRVTFPEELRSRIYQQCTDDEPVRKIIYSSEDDRFKLKKGYTPPNSVENLVDKLTTTRPRQIKPNRLSKTWIFARLWDTRLREPTVFDWRELDKYFVNWLDIWGSCDVGQLGLRNELEVDTWNLFVSTALKILRENSMMADWKTFRDSQLNLDQILHSNFYDKKDTPQTIIDRYKWASIGNGGYLIVNYGDTVGAYLTSLILNEILPSTWLDSTTFENIMDVFSTHPYCLVMMADRAEHNPQIYADLLMYPATCTLGCYLIANWTFRHGGWYAEAQESATLVTKSLALEDVMSMLHFHLKSKAINASEISALYRYIYNSALDIHSSKSSFDILSLIHELLSQLEPEYIKEVYLELLDFCKKYKEPQVFFALLEFLNETGISNEIDSVEPVQYYLDQIFLDADNYKIQKVNFRNAKTLVHLALKCQKQLSTRFLNSLDIETWMKSAPTESNALFSFNREITKRIKLQISLLANSIAHWETKVIPNELVEALSSAIISGSKNDDVNFKIDVFVPGPGFGFTLLEDQKIALYIANALIKLQSQVPNFEKLINAVLEIEEPNVLAIIISNTPTYINKRIKQQLIKATPEISPAVWSLPALQIRVESLLNADMPEVAEKFIVAENNAKTLGRVQGREIAAIRANLRALVLRKDWSAIEQYQLPNSLNQHQRNEAADLLLFIRGNSEILKESGDLVKAENIFTTLSNKDKNNTAYSLNLFASRVQRLISPNAFALLDGAQLNKAKVYMANAERDIRPKLNEQSDKNVLDTNLAFLQLAAGLNQETLQNLIKLREIQNDVKLEGLRALAIARLNSLREAKAALTVAEKIFGRHEFLISVRKEIDQHSIFSTRSSREIDEDPVLEIRQKLIELRGIDAVAQAEVMHEQGIFELYLLDVVRDSCTSLVALAPMMRTLGMTFEDDINSLLKHLLVSRFELIQWSVDDQSKGGQSPNEKPGERDLKINKGNRTLAVIEALIVESNEAVNLTAHFKKLFAYSTCKNFFHVTYARCAKISEILKTLGELSKSPPTDIHFKYTKPLEDIDDRPIGFSTCYSIDQREIFVNFLVLDMYQKTQKNAAKEATEVRKPRKNKPPKQLKS